MAPPSGVRAYKRSHSLSAIRRTSTMGAVGSGRRARATGAPLSVERAVSFHAGGSAEDGGAKPAQGAAAPRRPQAMAATDRWGVGGEVRAPRRG